MPRLLDHPPGRVRQRPPAIRSSGVAELADPGVIVLAAFLEVAGLARSDASEVASLLDSGRYADAIRALSGKGIEVVRRREWYGVYYKIMWTR